MCDKSWVILRSYYLIYMQWNTKLTVVWKCTFMLKTIKLYANLFKKLWNRVLQNSLTKKLKNVGIHRWQQILVQNKNLIVGDLIRLFPEDSTISNSESVRILITESLMDKYCSVPSRWWQRLVSSKETWKFFFLTHIQLCVLQPILTQKEIKKEFHWKKYWSDIM